MLGRHGRPQLVLLEGHRGQSLAVAGVIPLDVLGEVALVPETFQAARQQAPERFLSCKVKKSNWSTFDKLKMHQYSGKITSIV